MFADPPYGKGLGERALIAAARGGWLVAGALAILEERADVRPQFSESFESVDERAFGDTLMHFLRFRGA
ncbi:16S rRNA G966 N2-methylase RsmD [Sinorhizobium medicae]